jgi:hypothetical protein
MSGPSPPVTATWYPKIKALGGSFLQKWFFALLLPRWRCISLAPSLLQLLLDLEWSCCVMRSEQAEPVTLFITELIRVPVFEPLRRELLLTRRYFIFPFCTQRPAGNCIVKSRVGRQVISLRISTDFSLTTQYD